MTFGSIRLARELLPLAVGRHIRALHGGRTKDLKSGNVDRAA
jgi:hypothetical protein